MASQLSDLMTAFGAADRFSQRHIGPDEPSTQAMLRELGYGSLEELIAEAVPKSIQLSHALDLPAALGETEALAELKAIALQNKVMRSLIGMGYSDCITPPVIQ